jgi:hypothetical protein
MKRSRKSAKAGTLVLSIGNVYSGNIGISTR